MLCLVTPGTNGRPGMRFVSLEDLIENERVLRLSGMVFHDRVLTFVANRRALIPWGKINALWDQSQDQTNMANQATCEARPERSPNPPTPDYTKIAGGERIPSYSYKLTDWT